MRISFVFGTRPEAIKLAPVISEFIKQNTFEVNVCFTGQHQEMVIPIFELFNLNIDVNLHTMRKNQTLSEVVGRMFTELGQYISEVKPDIIVVQGDTTTAMVAATVGFYAGIKIAHVEAGLRTHDINSPFPEEFNRVVISKIAHFHFTPTTNASAHLLNEGVDEKKIILTGNTGIDALLYAVNKIADTNKKIEPWEEGGKKIVLITCHRRENFGVRLESICEAIKTLAERYPAINFVYPVHLNPNIKDAVQNLLSNVSNIFLIEPQSYFNFVALMAKSYLILTDSGGIQEEAPSLNKPVLVLRDNTERQEAVEAGTAKLVGTATTDIIENTIMLLENEIRYQEMAHQPNPFGDGNAAMKIHEHLRKLLD